jgi:PKD repeat protein/archaellum component FlaF (FlaF/FlaG flagellin family)
LTRQKNLGLSTVFMAVLMLILTITVASILFFTLHSFGYATQEALNFEEERMREEIAIISLTTENVSGTEYVASLLVNNTGSIICRIRGVYVNSEFICDPSESASTYLNPAESKNIVIPLDKRPVYNPISTLTISSERGIKSTEIEWVLKGGGGEPSTYETQFYFGPLMLDFDQFYHTESDSSGSFDPTSWKPGWKVEIGSGSIVWNITVKNVDYRNITINQFSCFTLFPNKSPSNRRAWYLEPAGAPYTQFIQVNQTAHLIYIWDRAKLENPRPQDIYSTESRCKVFLTFFGIFHEPDGTTKPYGQTIPFEAVLVVPPSLSISANPQVLLYPNTTSIITATVNENGIPLENANVTFTTNLGTLSDPWALTTADGRATVTLRYSGSPGTATVTATWQERSESVTVLMNAVPVANFTENYHKVLTNEPINFDASASYDPDGTIVSYYWDFGDGTNGTGIITNHVYSDDGTYVVTLAVRDNYGATASIAENKTILNQPPVSLFTINGFFNETINVPINETVNFSASASFDPDGSIIMYYWNFGDTTNGTGLSLNHTYGNGGTFFVTLTVTDNDDEIVTSSTKTIVVE